LTEEEILDLAQRLKIAQLIIVGKTYDEISEKVDTSTSTVSKIGQILKFGKEGLKKALSKKSKGGLPTEASAKVAGHSEAQKAKGGGTKWQD